MLTTHGIGIEGAASLARGSANDRNPALCKTRDLAAVNPTRDWSCGPPRRWRLRRKLIVLVFVARIC
jgi:hypothetical protein